MDHRILTSMGGLVSALALLAPLPAAAQPNASAPTSVAAAALPRTPDGKPDLQGVWDFKTITPMERPHELGTKEFFTAEEAAAWERDENRRQNRDLIDPRQGGLNYVPGGVVPYNEFWYERGDKAVGTRRTSLIIDLTLSGTLIDTSGAPGGSSRAIMNRRSTPTTSGAYRSFIAISRATRARLAGSTGAR